MLNNGGFYIIDDMLPQPNWPEGHDDKVKHFISQLEERNDITDHQIKLVNGNYHRTKK